MKIELEFNLPHPISETATGQYCCKDTYAQQHIERSWVQFRINNMVKQSKLMKRQTGPSRTLKQDMIHHVITVYINTELHVPYLIDVSIT